MENSDEETRENVSDKRRYAHMIYMTIYVLCVCACARAYAYMAQFGSFHTSCAMP